MIWVLSSVLDVCRIWCEGICVFVIDIERCVNNDIGNVCILLMGGGVE